MTKTLREVIDHAMDQVDTYKYPDLQEFIERLTPIIKAGNYRISLDDEITHIGLIANRGLSISTRYSVRCCEQIDDVVIPFSIIDHEDPVFEARRQYLDMEVKTAAGKLAVAKADVERYGLTLAKAQVEYQNHEKGNANAHLLDQD